MKAIAVYCASSSDLEEKYYQMARELGRQIAQAGYELVNGGGAFGLMGATIDGCLSAGGEAVGVIPEFMDQKGWAHPGLSQKIVTSGMHTRKETMASLATAGAIALPGGIGTLEEFAEIITWRKLHLYSHPVVLLNFDGFYNPLIELIDRMTRLNFLTDQQSLFVTASTTQEAVNQIKG